MLKENQRVAIYLEGHLHSEYGKMGIGAIRYLPNKIVAVIDSKNADSDISSQHDISKNIPIVKSLKQAIDLGAEVLILGIANSGGKILDEWIGLIKEALEKGLSLVNGMHDQLADRYNDLIQHDNQWIWDVRVPQFVPYIGSGKAMTLNNIRVLMIGTDMGSGKMTSGLELFSMAKKDGYKSSFIATGQVGITITGKGIPLDAYMVDHACGAVEKVIMDEKDKELIIIEGQGSILHPGSTATLPLMRGSCPTHMILCHRASAGSLRHPKNILFPDLNKFIKLNEDLVSVCGTYKSPKVIGIALNTYRLSNEEAEKEIKQIEKYTGIPTTDFVRFGPSKIWNLIKKG